MSRSKPGRTPTLGPCHGQTIGSSRPVRVAEFPHQRSPGASAPRAGRAASTPTGSTPVSRPNLISPQHAESTTRSEHSWWRSWGRPFGWSLTPAGHRPATGTGPSTCSRCACRRPVKPGGSGGQLDPEGEQWSDACGPSVNGANASRSAAEAGTATERRPQPRRPANTTMSSAPSFWASASVNP